MPRPTDYTEEKAALIISQLEQGIPLAEICRQEGMPSATTVRAWAEKIESFGVSYAHAREDGEDLLAVSLRKVANGDPGFSTGDVQRDKIKIDTDFRLLKVFNPKKYGEKATTEVTTNVSITPAISQLDTWLIQHGLAATQSIDAGAGKERPVLLTPLHPQSGGYGEAVVV